MTGHLCRRRARTGVLLAALLVALAVGASLAACGGAADDPFAGVYWEPSTGRRVEILKDGDAYRLIYGAQKRPFTAVLEGDELHVAEPLGGETVVRQGAETGTLELVAGGETTVLKPLPQHQ